MIGTGVIIGLALAGLWALFRNSTGESEPVFIPHTWHPVLEQKVRYFRELDATSQARFLEDVGRFLSRVKVNGVHIEVTLEDRMLVASSAVIPLFGFPGWDYQHLDEVVLLPGHFDRDLNFQDPKECITGMVGGGVLEGKMLLSRKALHVGFDNSQDKGNVGIHEFIHIYDKEDGLIDGIPSAFVDKSFVLPWLKQVEGEMRAIAEQESSIQNYGATNQEEFLAVAGEYFFERPHLLKEKHPELYQMLVKTFRQDPSSFLERREVKVQSPGRNDFCPCGSGLKYKRCCLNS